MTTHNFKKGQKVRARDNKDNEWVYGTFLRKREGYAYSYVIFRYSNGIDDAFKICEPVEDVIVSEWIPKEGELIEVSDVCDFEYSWEEYFVEKCKSGYVTRESGRLCLWAYARPLQFVAIVW